MKSEGGYLTPEEEAALAAQQAAGAPPAIDPNAPPPSPQSYEAQQYAAGNVYSTGNQDPNGGTVAYPAQPQQPLDTSSGTVHTASEPPSPPTAEEAAQAAAASGPSPILTSTNDYGGVRGIATGAVVSPMGGNTSYSGPKPHTAWSNEVIAARPEAANIYAVETAAPAATPSLLPRSDGRRPATPNATGGAGLGKGMVGRGPGVAPTPNPGPTRREAVGGPANGGPPSFSTGTDAAPVWQAMRAANAERRQALSEIGEAATATDTGLPPGQAAPAPTTPLRTGNAIFGRTLSGTRAPRPAAAPIPTRAAGPPDMSGTGTDAAPTWAAMRATNNDARGGAAPTPGVVGSILEAIGGEGTVTPRGTRAADAALASIVTGANGGAGLPPLPRSSLPTGPGTSAMPANGGPPDMTGTGTDAAPSWAAMRGTNNDARAGQPGGGPGWVGSILEAIGGEGTVTPRSQGAEDARRASIVTGANGGAGLPMPSGDGGNRGPGWWEDFKTEVGEGPLANIPGARLIGTVFDGVPNATYESDPTRPQEGNAGYGRKFGRPDTVLESMADNWHQSNKVVEAAEDAAIGAVASVPSAIGGAKDDALAAEQGRGPQESASGAPTASGASTGASIPSPSKIGEPAKSQTFMPREGGETRDPKGGNRVTIPGPGGGDETYVVYPDGAMADESGNVVGRMDPATGDTVRLDGTAGPNINEVGRHADQPAPSGGSSGGSSGETRTSSTTAGGGTSGGAVSVGGDDGRSGSGSGSGGRPSTPQEEAAVAEAAPEGVEVVSVTALPSGSADGIGTNQAASGSGTSSGGSSSSSGSSGGSSGGGGSSSGGGSSGGGGSSRRSSGGGGGGGGGGSWGGGSSGRWSVKTRDGRTWVFDEATNVWTRDDGKTVMGRRRFGRSRRGRGMGAGFPFGDGFPFGGRGVPQSGRTAFGPPGFADAPSPAPFATTGFASAGGGGGATVDNAPKSPSSRKSKRKK